MKHLSPIQIATTAVPLKTRYRKIIEWVSKRYGVSIEKMLGRSHKAQFVRARYIAINLVWRHPQTRHLSMGRIGAMFGGRDHSTIRFAVLHYTKMDRYLADTAVKLVVPPPLPRAPKGPRYDETAVFREFMAGDECKIVGRRHGIRPGLVSAVAIRIVRRAVNGVEQARQLAAEVMGCDQETAIARLLLRYRSALLPTRRSK